MVIKLYKTGFNVAKNGVYERLEEYLAALNPTYVTEYKYVEPSLSADIKLPVDSHLFSKKALGDYVVMQDGEHTYYYYVLNAKWRGKETLLLSLGLDTLNTYWADIEESISDNTHILRRFKDRYNIIEDEDIALPVIDRHAESFNAVPMIRASSSPVLDSNDLNDRWYLVYKTLYESTEALAKNPTSYMLFPEKEVRIKTANSRITWTAEMFEGDTSKAWAVKDPTRILFKNLDTGETTPLQISKLVELNAETTETKTIDQCLVIIYSDVAKRFTVKLFETIGGDEYSIAADTDEIIFEYIDKLYVQDLSAASAWSKTPSSISTGSYNIFRCEDIQMPTFKSWYGKFKIDPRLIKIRELPYCPFKLTKNSDGTLSPQSYIKLELTQLFPPTLRNSVVSYDDYADSYWVKMINGSDDFRPFKQYNIGVVACGLPTLSKADIERSLHSIEHETKLYSSSYKTTKFIYDSAQWIVQPELMESRLPDDFDITIAYKVSDGIDNGLMFSFYTSQAAQTDFSERMIVDRNTDIPYYTNEYLNYIRYGKKIDDVNKKYDIASAVVGGVGSAITTGITAGFGLSNILTSGAAVAAGPVGAVAGLIVGAAVTGVSIASAVAKSNQAINEKIDAYSHQASAVNGASDVSIFDEYSGNALRLVNYEPPEDIRKSLYDYFRLYGYATDEYSKPICSREYYDYFKAEPEFSNEMIWHDFLEDIKVRMQAGYTVFHFVDGAYDLDQKYENWENSLIAWAEN